MQQQVHTAKVQEVYTLRKREEKEAGRGQYQVDLWEIKIYVHVRGRQTICMYGKQVHLRAHQGICQTFIQRVSPERESAIEEFQKYSKLRTEVRTYSCEVYTYEYVLGI